MFPSYRPATPAELDVCQRIDFWSVPARNQGQIVEVAYSAGPSMRRPHECDVGDPYRRTTDRGTGEVTFEVLAK